jgi:hypothetical protein
MVHAYIYTLIHTQDVRNSAMTYHRGNEIPGLLGLTRGWSRVVFLLVGREQLMKGQQAIVLGLGWLAAPGLIERALAHGASWSLAGRPPGFDDSKLRNFQPPWDLVLFFF